MGIGIKQIRTVSTFLELTNEEAKAVTSQYLRDVVIGDGVTVTGDGRLEHWTKEPHGSGTTTDMGKASPTQIAAWAFLSASH